MTRSRTWMAAVAGLALAAGVAAPAAWAQAPTPSPTQPAPAQPAAPAPAPEAPPNTGRVSLAAGADWASAYYFRGIVTTQNGGNNVQPYGEVAFRLLENMGPLTSLSVAPGIWTNLHWGGGTVVDPSDPKFWTETDWYFKVSAVWWEALTTSVTYTYYTSPNNTFASFADVAVSAALNDSKWLGAFALNPSIMFAFETTGEALVSADAKKGIYWQIGLAPGYTFFAESSFPTTISAPMTFGFSAKDYYTVNGNNQEFGYFSFGPLITMPLKFVPAAYGSWSFKGGVQFLVLNTNLKAINTPGDGFVPVGSVGISMTY
ncbi:MAG: hypothetical protein ACRELZ_09015 [Candidatus Rokuibacteriota bacterium]